MALQIDLSTLNFSNFSVAYVPATDEPVICDLPAAGAALNVPLFTPEETDLVCQLAFPDVTPLPPVVVPLPEFPESCTDFSASVAVNFFGAASKSFLTTNIESVPDCGFDLRGFINVEACETFRADAKVTFDSSRPNSLEFISSGTPNCGAILAGNIGIPSTGGVSVEVCRCTATVTFTLDTNVPVAIRDLTTWVVGGTGDDSTLSTLTIGGGYTGIGDDAGFSLPCGDYTFIATPPTGYIITYEERTGACESEDTLDFTATISLDDRGDTQDAGVDTTWAPREYLVCEDGLTKKAWFFGTQRFVV